jgi:hypothetical protein
VRYCSGTKDPSQFVSAEGHMYFIEVYVDASWASCVHTRKSVSSGVIRLGGSTVFTWSRSQTCVAQSSGESEFYAIVEGINEGIGLRRILEEIGMLLPVRVLTDSTAGKAVCHRLGAGQKLRHVEVKWFHVQDLVQKKEVTVYKVDGVSNCADLGTKPVTQAVLKKLLPMAGLAPLEIIDLAGVGAEHAAATNPIIDQNMAKKMLQVLMLMQSIVPATGQFIGTFTFGVDRSLVFWMLIIFALSTLWICMPRRTREVPRQMPRRLIETEIRSTQTDREEQTSASSSSSAPLYRPPLPTWEAPPSRPQNPSEVSVSMAGQGAKYHLSYSCVSSKTSKIGRFTPCFSCSRQP